MARDAAASATTSSRSTRRSSSTRGCGRRRGHLAGFTDPLVDCRTCGQRFRADHLDRAAVPAQALQAPGRGPGVRPHRGARVQPDVRDDDRPGEGGGLDRLPAPRDRAGDLPQLQERAAVRAQEAAVRDRADRQVVPQRDHARATSSSARASSSRWRWSSSSRRPRRQQWYEYWLPERMRLVHATSGIRPDHLRLRAHDADELAHYSTRHERRRVPVPDRLVGARGHRQPRRLRPHPARRALAARSSSTSTPPAASATCRT